MRPQSITILCILLFVIGVSLALRSIGQFVLAPGMYSFFMLLVSLLGLYSYYGLWIMKRWSIPVFLLTWSLITLPALISNDGFSTVMLLRIAYLVGMLVVFMIVVLPHTNKLTQGAVWDFKPNRDLPSSE